MSDYPPCKFCQENSFETLCGATFCINCGTERNNYENSFLKVMCEYSPKPSIIECRVCHENSFEIHDGATFCINCGTESKEHGQELVYEIQDLIEDTESEEDDENLDYPDHDTDEEENNELSEDSDEFSAVDTNIKSNKIVKLLAQHSIFTTTTF